MNGIDNQAFGYMTAATDKTDVDLWKPSKQRQPEIGPYVEGFDIQSFMEGFVGGGGGIKVGVKGARAITRKVSNVLADQGILTPIKKGAGTITMPHVLNSIIEWFGKTSRYKPLGVISKAAGKVRHLDISVTEKSIPNISDRGMDLVKRLQKRYGNVKSYDEEMLMNVIKGSGRPARIVKIVDRDSGITIFQPFYKSTGTGVPGIKSKGKWLPFEGLLPRGHSVTTINKGIGTVSKGKDAIFKYELGPGEMPAGWLIKGFKSPRAPDKIFSSSSGGVPKEGLDIHRSIGKMLRDIK